MSEKWKNIESFIILTWFFQNWQPQEIHVLALSKNSLKINASILTIPSASNIMTAFLKQNFVLHFPKKQYTQHVLSI